MIAIYKRELKAFMNTMTGWIFVAAMMFITGIYFIAVNLMGGYSNITYTVSNSLFVYIIAIPFLTMRILTEERRQKIDQLIFTAPVSLWKIVLGKYLAMATVLLIPSVVFCTYPLVLTFYGTVALAEAYVAILGFFLYGLASISLALFLSSLTESVVIAAIISFAAMFVTYIMSGLINIVTNTSNAFTKFLGNLLGCFDFGSHITNMLNGILDIRSLIYFIIIVLVFLFLTVQVMQKRRFTVSKSTLSVGAYSSTMVVIVVAVAVVANLIVNEIPDKYMSIDVTGQNLYSISDTSKDLIANLDKDVQIYVISDENNKDDMVDKTIRQYTENSNHITCQYKDPVTNPSFYKQYSSDKISQNSLIVVCGDKYRVIDASDLYVQELDYSTYSYTVTGYDAEGQITSAINYVTMESMPTAYCIKGHGETSLESNFTDAIEKLNIQISDINLMDVDSVPEDAEFIVIAAPQTDYSKDDADKIKEYIKKGGNLYVCTYMMDDPAGTLPNFSSILAEFGVEVVPGVIVEQDSNYYYQSPYYLLPKVQYSSLTNGVYNQKYIFAPYSQGLIIDDTDENVSVQSLLKSSDSSMAYTDGADVATLEEKSYDLGAFVEKTFDDNTSTMLIFTSISMLSNDADKMVSNANSTLFGNCIAQFAPQDTGNISIPSKNYTNDTLVIDNAMGILYGVIFAVVLPLTLIVIGFVIWFRRRKK